MANKRITDQVTDTALSAGDYIIVDSSTEGTRKFDLGTELTDIKSDLAQVSVLSEDFKQALHDILENVAYIDEDGQDYLDALDGAMWPQATPIGITATFTQTIVVGTDTTLNALKANLVVEVEYSDGTSQETNTYTLSGTLEEGTSTITVTKGAYTATFDVTVSYTRLEYIESSGTQYIDTGIVLDFYDEVEIKLRDSVTENFDKVYFGTTDGTSAGNHRVILSGYKASNANTFSARWTADSPSPAVPRTVGSDVVIKLTNNSATAKTVTVYNTSGIVLNTGNTRNNNSSNMPNYSTYLFGRNPGPDSGADLYCSTLRVYEFIITTQGGEKRLHLVPVSKNSTICMFDTVSSTFFENLGTGDFTGA